MEGVHYNIILMKQVESHFPKHDINSLLYERHFVSLF